MRTDQVIIGRVMTPDAYARATAPPLPAKLSRHAELAALAAHINHNLRTDAPTLVRRGVLRRRRDLMTPQQCADIGARIAELTGRTPRERLSEAGR